MQSIWILAVSNLRKNKGQTIGLLILMIMTALFMNIGLVMYFGVGKFYDKRTEELNTAHFATQQKENAENTARYDFIRSFPDVTEVETQRILHGVGDIFLNEERTTTPLIIADGTDQNQHMNPPYLTGEYLPLEGNAIFIPYGIFLSGGYEIGSTFLLELEGEKMEFIVAGSTEEIFYGISPRIYVSSAVFNELYSHFTKQRFTLISARTKDGNAGTLSENFAKEFSNNEDGGFLTLSYPEVRASRITNATVAALFIVIFSFFVLLIGIIVIRFRINNDIEENMTNIGILKAIGYRNKQIIFSIIVQFGMTALIGSVFGVLSAQFITPMTGSMIEPIMGIRWNSKTEILYMAVSLFIVLLIVTLFSGISSWRIAYLHPLPALRGSISTHNAVKNYIPLEKSHIPLNVHFALKQLLLNRKQTITLCLIITGLSFISTFGLTIYYHVNSDAFRQSVVIDDMDISVALNDSMQGPAFNEYILTLPEIKSIYGRDEITLDINDIQVNTVVIENFSSVDINLIEGRFPLHNNEILMGGAVMRDMGVRIGDWINVGIDDNTDMYLVTGMIQTQIDSGAVAVLDLNGFHTIQTDYTFETFAIILAPGADGHSLVEELSQSKGSVISDIYYTKPFLEAQLDVLGGIYTSISIILLLTVVFVVSIVLYLLIKTTILRKRRELGIQKALGFTNMQLMNQIALNILPVTLVGAILGTITGIISFNPIYLAYLKKHGIVYSNLFIPLFWSITLCGLMILLTYVVSMLIARKIRKISAYALVTES